MDGGVGVMMNKEDLLRSRIGKIRSRWVWDDLNPSGYILNNQQEWGGNPLRQKDLCFIGELDTSTLLLKV